MMEIKQKVIIYCAVFLFGLVPACLASAATQIYRSVGPGATSAIDTGSETDTLIISGTTATFSTAVDNSIGVGDVIQYNISGTYYAAFIHGRTDSTHYTVANAFGSTPEAVSGNTNWNIYRAYTSLRNAEQGNENDSLENTVEDFDNWDGTGDYTDTDEVGKDISSTGSNEQWNIACYANGTTADAPEDPVSIDGWTTGAVNYIRIYTPYNVNEVGTSQRHQGKWDINKYRLSSAISGNYIIYLNDFNIKLQGLQIENSSTANSANGLASSFDSGTADLEVAYNIFKGPGSSAAGHIGMMFGGDSTTLTARVYNNLIYDWGTYNSFAGIRQHSPWNLYLYNNTVIGSYYGFIGHGDRAARAINNIAQDCTDGFYLSYGSWGAGTNYNISDLPNDAPSASYRTNLATEATFVNEAGDDFHLSPNDQYAQDHGANMDDDTYLAFSSDIDSEGRPGTWDIGADEYTENGAFTLSGWVRLTGASNVSKAIIAKADEFRLTTDWQGYPRCQIKSGGQWQAAAVSSTALGLNEWAHVACAYDKSTLKVYVNGIQKDSDSLSIGVDNTSASLKFAVDDSTDGTYGDFQGFMDEVRMYPYARSATQIKFDYNAGLAGLSAKRGVGVTFGNESEKWMSEGLVGYWRMDESSWNGTASEVIDHSGNGNHGTGAGGVTTGVGKFGKGGVFDGVDDYVNMNNNYNSPVPFSISVWAKNNDVLVESEARRDRIFYNFSSSEATWGVGFGYDNGDFRFTKTGVSDLDLDIGSWPTGWFHAVWVVDSDNDIELFVDGISKGKYGNINNFNTQVTNVARIGRDSGGYYWDGLIDEIRIYNRALSSEEIKKLYEWAPKPVNHIRMDEKVSGDAQTLQDNSGYQRNATSEQGSNSLGMDCTQRGKYGSGCDLDGIDDYMQISDFDY